MPNAVTEGSAGWNFVCPMTDGSCGPVPWSSTGWPTKKLATVRGQQHLDEHAEGTAAKAENREVDQSKLVQNLDEFRAEHGVIVTDDGRAVQNKKG